MITLYRFPYSCYALKIQYLLDYLQLEYTVKDVPFCHRDELVRVSGGVTVPAIEHNGRGMRESRDICQYIINLVDSNLVPAGMEAAVWAYVDWSDSDLEDKLFRIASPNIAEKFPTPAERAMFVFIKERKFGTGCVDQWAEHKSTYIAKAQSLLSPTLKSIQQNGFIIGSNPTLADFSLLGHLAMVEYADPRLVNEIDRRLLPYMNKVRELRYG